MERKWVNFKTPQKKLYCSSVVLVPMKSPSSAIICEGYSAPPTGIIFAAYLIAIFKIVIYQIDHGVEVPTNVATIISIMNSVVS